MENITYTLSLKENLADKVLKINIQNNKQLEVWSKVQQRVNAASDTYNKCGTTIGGLRERVIALQAQRRWIPADNIEAIASSNREIEKLKKQIHGLENVTGGKLQSWLKSAEFANPYLNKLLDPLKMIESTFKKISSFVRNSEDVWMKQAENESKLAGAMQQTMQAGKEEVKGIVDITAAQQKLGVISQHVQLSGAKELALHLNRTESMQTLIPVINDVLASQYGLNATQEDAAGVASLMGKAMKGQIQTFEQNGYQFTEAQRKVMKYGTEVERAATLAEVVTKRVGGMNEAFAATPEGKLKQQADAMALLQSRVGKLYTEVKGALTPVFEVMGRLAEKCVKTFEQNREKIMQVIHGVAAAFERAYPVIESACEKLFSAVGWVIRQFEEGNPLVIYFTFLLGGLATVISVVTVLTKIWAMVTAMHPITWIIAAVMALIGAIAYLCYKIEGWNTLWSGTMDFIRYSFEAAIGYMDVQITRFVNGFLHALDIARKGWYQLQLALGLGDETQHLLAIEKINEQIDTRRTALQEKKDQVQANRDKAWGALDNINLTWNSEKSVLPAVKDFGGSLGIESPSLPGFSSMRTEGDLTNTSAVSGAVQSISGGGMQNNTISISLNSLVENIVFDGGFEGSRDDMQRDLETQLIRVLHMARSAQ